MGSVYLGMGLSEDLQIIRQMMRATGDSITGRKELLEFNSPFDFCRSEICVFV